MRTGKRLKTLLKNASERQPATIRCSFAFACSFCSFAKYFSGSAEIIPFKKRSVSSFLGGSYFSALKTKLLASNKHRCQLVICSISAFTVGPVPQRTHPYSCRGCPKAYLPVLNFQKHLISTEKHEALQYRRAVNRMEEAWCLDFAFVLLKPRPKMCIRLNLSRSRRNYRRRRPNRSQMIKIKRTRLPIPPPT
jgi:hypothetical protein